MDTGYEEIINPAGTPGRIAYARVSTADQDPQLQIDALTAHGCRRLFVEKISSRTRHRPGLAAALHRLDPGDTLVVWKLDRLGRSVTEVVGLAEKLNGMGVGLHILTGTLEGTYHPSGSGKFFFTIMAAFAELERDLIHERTLAGLAAALHRLDPGDTLVVWKLDRLGRSVTEVVGLAETLHGMGVGLHILTGILEGTYHPTGSGKFFFTIMAAFAELERDLIHERTLAGLAAARAQGRIGGRPAKLDADKLAAAKARRARGESLPQIAQALGVSASTVHRHLKKEDFREFANSDVPAGGT